MARSLPYPLAMRTATFLLAASLVMPPASPAGASEPLDLEAAWAEALANNPSLLGARAEVSAAKAELAIVRPILPNPSLAGSFDSDFVFENLGEKTVRVELEQELPLFGTRSAAIDRARARIESAQASFAASATSLFARLRTAMAAAAEATSLRELRWELSQVASGVADAARRRADVGDTSRADANLAEVEAAAAYAELEQATAAEQAALSELCALLGRSSCGALAAAWPAGGAEVPGEEELVAEALRRRADLSAAQAAEVAANAAIRGAERARIPIPSVAVGYTNEKLVFDEPGLGFSKVDHFLGFAFRVPLPIWSQGGGQVALAHAERSSAEAQLRELHSRIPAEVRAARARMASARASAEKWESVQPRIDETLGWMRRGFEAGAISIETYLVSRDRLVRAQQGLLASKRELVAASAELDLAIGRIPSLPEGVVR